jgi:hypothetical protein
MHRRVALALLIVLTGCSPSAVATPAGSSQTVPRSTPSGSVAHPTASPTAVAPSPSDRVAGWRADLDGFLAALDTIHPDLYHDTSKTDFERAVSDLRATVPTATDDALMVGACRLVALVSAHGRDSHTGLYPWSPDSRFPVHSLPLRLWLFPDGIHVIDALAPYGDLVGTRLVTVAGHPAADVERALVPLIPRDNDATVRLLTPRFLLMPEVLHGLGLVDGIGPMDAAVVDAKGASRTVSITPIPMADYNAWAGPYGLFLPADPKVRYLSRMEEPLWWTRLEDGTLYVQYNRVDFVDTQAAELATVLQGADVKRVVVDIRHNYGGEFRALDAVVNAFDIAKFATAGRLFLVTGRNTYSGGSIFAGELQARTSLTIVGEPMGGSPDPWADPDDYRLPWSGLAITVATLLEPTTPPNDVRLGIDPDLPVPLTYADWAAGRDPALEAILARKFVP